MYKLSLPIILLILISGCTSFDEIPIVDTVTQPDYVSSKKAKKLEIPPDLDDIDTSNKFLIGGEPTSLKKYQNKEQQKLPNIINDDVQKIKVVKSGSMRWLVVPARQKEVWPVVESFWEDMGFDISSSKQTGIIETKWLAESELKRDDSSLGMFDAWLDSLGNTGSRRKFRTRVEDGVKEGTTEIYLSQRSLLDGLDDHIERKERHYEGTVNPETVYKIQEYKSDKNNNKLRNVSNFKEDDLEIQYELLRRLMIRLGTTDLRARESLDTAVEIKNAELINQNDHKYIKLNDTYSRAWRRLNLAIDMVGFLVEDKNRSNGIFYIKYSNLEIDEDRRKKTKNNNGLISKLAFWRDDDNDLEEDQEGQEMYRKEIEGDEQDEIISNDSEKNWSEKTWEEKFPFFADWGDDDEQNVPDGEKRFRIRIVEVKDGVKVYIDYPDESLNKTKTAQSIINILYDYLKS